MADAVEVVRAGLPCTTAQGHGGLAGWRHSGLRCGKTERTGAGGMTFRIESFDRYFASASETEAALLGSASPYVDALRSYHRVFERHVFGSSEGLSVAQCLLAMHAFMIYMGSVRVALSGHAAATFPLFRTALESACYAFLIGEVEGLGQVWWDRNSSEEAFKRCRGRFSGAVKEAAAAIQRKRWIGPRTEEWINELYDAAIDFGAHPNAKSVLPYLAVDGDGADGPAVSLTSLYGPEARATSRGLVACLDHGLVIAVILASCVDAPSEEAVASIHEMNELKEGLAADYLRGLDG